MEDQIKKLSQSSKQGRKFSIFESLSDQEPQEDYQSADFWNVPTTTDLTQQVQENVQTTPVKEATTEVTTSVSPTTLEAANILKEVASGSTLKTYKAQKKRKTKSGIKVGVFTADSEEVTTGSVTVIWKRQYQEETMNRIK